MKPVYHLIAYDHPALPIIIALSIGNPTQEKIAKVIEEYNAPSRYLVGCFVSNKLVAVIGFEIASSLAIVKQMSVIPEFQGLGIGKELIQFVLESFSLTSLSAETDDEAVGFYQTVGFICQPFEGEYGRRYHCQLTKGKI